MTADPVATDTAVATAPVPTRSRRRARGILGAIAVVMGLAALPFVGVPVPGLLPGPISSPGSLQILAIGLIFAGVAISYDVIFGFTGLLSFGHALFFALGVYGTNVGMRDLGLAYPAAVAVAVLVAATVAAVIGAVALRTRGVAFAMVTLAFAEAGSIFLLADPLRVSGGEEGIPIVGDQVPDLLRGVANTDHLYWMALAFVVTTYILARLAVDSMAGRVWQAIRDNEDRVELLGLRPMPFKLVSFTSGCALAAAGGAVYLLLVRGSNPGVASADFTLALLVMVVLGGAGRLWGAAIGGMAYALATLRLSALGTSGVLDGLPDWAERIVSEPLFVLGTGFVLLMMFAPGGLAGALQTLRVGTRRAPTGRAHP